AKDASAAVVDVGSFDFPFVADYDTYWCEVDSLEEGYYLCAFLNSGYANRQIKDFQARGLFGPRHVTKTIVGLPFPRFSLRNADHQLLGDLGNKCAVKASKIISAS